MAAVLTALQIASNARKRTDAALTYDDDRFVYEGPLMVDPITKTTMGQPILTTRPVYKKSSVWSKIRQFFTKNGTGRHRRTMGDEWTQ